MIKRNCYDMKGESLEAVGKAKAFLLNFYFLIDISLGPDTVGYYLFQRLRANCVDALEGEFARQKNLLTTKLSTVFACQLLLYMICLNGRCSWDGISEGNSEGYYYFFSG